MNHSASGLVSEDHRGAWRDVLLTPGALPPLSPGQHALQVGKPSQPSSSPVLAQLQALKTFVPSLATYGVAGGSLVVFIASEWKGKDLLQYVPIYNRSVTAPGLL